MTLANSEQRYQWQSEEIYLIFQVKHSTNERNFRKRSLSPRNDEDLYNPELPSEDNSPQHDVLQDQEQQNHSEVRELSPANKQQRSRSRSTSPIPAKHARRHSKSPEQQQSKIFKIVFVQNQRQVSLLQQCFHFL